MSLVKLTASVLAITAVSAAAAVAQSRDNVQIAGSSTVLPYATIVAEAFGENFNFATPVVEGGGSTAGKKKLCEGIGENFIDIGNASSRMKKSEQEFCAANGIGDIMEVRFGYDGVVFASDVNGPSFEFTPSDWYNALAAKVMKDGKLVDNTYANWNEIRAELPDQAIMAFIPGTKHGTREVFDTKVIEAGCKATGAEEALKAAGDDKGCLKLRTDGLSVDIDGDYTETLARLGANNNAIGVFGLSFYENNTDKLQVATMDGITPSTDTVADGSYPVSRPLFFYVKLAHMGVIPGLREYVNFFVSDDMAGPDGPLAAYGLVADPELAATQQMVADETPMATLEK